MTTPSDLLTRAADLIRDTAAVANANEWTFEAFEPAVWEGDARWIALMSPAVAGPVEQVFRAMVPAAEQAEAIPRESARVYPKGFHAVLALARAVLGEKEETDGQ